MKLPMLFWISLQDLDGIRNGFDWWENSTPEYQDSPDGISTYLALQAALKRHTQSRLSRLVPHAN